MSPPLLFLEGSSQDRDGKEKEEKVLSPLCGCVSPRCGCPVLSPRAAGSSSTPYPLCTLVGMGVSTRPCPCGLQGASRGGEHPSLLALEGTSYPGTGKGSALPFAAWAAQRAHAGTRFHSSSRVKS